MSTRHSLLLVTLFFGALFLVFFVLIASFFSLFQGGLSGQQSRGARIGVVEINGMLTDSKEYSRLIRQYETDGDIKAVLVRIDSPGGSVGPSQELFLDILRLRKSKKVVASLGSVAASGGYYIASAADKIIANPGTITGSIGVITQLTHVEELLSTIGIETTTFKSGPLKDSGSMFRKVEALDEHLFEGLLGDVFSQFLNDVAAQRGLDEETIAHISDGRVISGAQAKELGLVDELGNLWNAVEALQDLAGIDKDLPLSYPRKRFPFLVGLVEEASHAALGQIRAALTPRILFSLPSLP